jgi:hypothetical protein
MLDVRLNIFGLFTGPSYYWYMWPSEMVYLPKAQGMKSSTRREARHGARQNVGDCGAAKTNASSNVLDNGIEAPSFYLGTN